MKNVKQNKILKKNNFYISFLFSASLSMQLNAQTLDILDFKTQKKPILELNQLCQKNQMFCDKQSSIRLIELKDQLWVLSGLNIAQMARSGKSLKLLNTWQIRPNTVNENSEIKSFIYPKLFPMDQQYHAVALVYETKEYYSGGGAQIQIADFYALKPYHQVQRFIQNYPFYTSRMIRACFSYEDYQQAQDQCHDMYHLNLDIQIKQPMIWTFRYRYSQEISPVSDSGSKNKSEIKTITIDLKRPPHVLVLPESWNYQMQE